MTLTACMICRKPLGFCGGVYLAAADCTIMVGNGQFLLPLQLCLKDCIIFMRLVLSLRRTGGTAAIAQWRGKQKREKAS